MPDNTVLDARAAGAKRFQGKIVVVAGAGQGIGRATARRFAEEGASVVVGDMVEATAQKVVDEIKEVGGSAVPYVGNLSSWDNCQALMATAKENYGRIDVAANIVGGTIWSQFYWYYTPEQIIEEVNKSFWPSMWLCRAVLPYMIEQNGGSIVNLATHAVASQYRVPYAASKGGVIALTTSLSKEVAQFGIRVNCIAPHNTVSDDRVTPRNFGVEGVRGPGMPDDLEAERIRFFKEIAGREIALGRAAHAEEQASAIAFLASEDASFITGQLLPVGGGATYPF